MKPEVILITFESVPLDIRVIKFLQEYMPAETTEWAVGLMGAIRDGLPETFAKMPERDYTVQELWDLIRVNLADA